MSNLLETRSKEQRQRPAPLMPGGPSSNSIPIGILATSLLHVILFLGTPSTFRKPYNPPPNEYEELEFELAPEEQPEPPPLSFIEANPDAPDNVPDDPKFFAAQNQQAAQENPTPEDSDLPSTEGRDIPSSAIVTGERAEPQESANPGQQTQPSQEVTETQEQLQTEALMPLPGFEKVEGEDEEGIGTNIAELSENARPIEEPVEGSDQPTQDQRVVVAPQSPGRPSPQPRPRVQNVRPAPLASRPHGVSQAGQIGVNAEFSEFGDYLQELIEIVEAQWNLVLSKTPSRPVTGSKVSIRFTLNSEGIVSRIEEVEETAGKQGTYACLSAIQDRQPYRPWTKEMVAILGTEQVLTFNFYYW
jgi:hypothetical protein